MTATEWRSILLMSFTVDGSQQARVSLSGPVSAKRVGQIIRMLELTRESLAEDEATPAAEERRPEPRDG